MKKNLSVITFVSLGVLLLILALAGVNNQKISKDNDLNTLQNEKREDLKEETGFKLFESDEYIDNATKSKVIINGYYNDPSSLKKSDTLILKGLSSGEFIEVIVEGTIIDFQHLELEWNNETMDFIEKRVIHRFDRLENIAVVIKTYMPDGIPLEKIKWKSLSGKTYMSSLSENINEVRA